MRRSLLLFLNNPVNPLFALRRLTRGRRPGSLGSNLALQGNLAPAPGSGPPKHDRRCDEDGGIRPDDDTNDDREREIPQHCAAKEEQAQNRNQRDGAGKDGAAKRLIDAFVHDLFDRAFARWPDLHESGHKPRWCR